MKNDSIFSLAEAASHSGGLAQRPARSLRHGHGVARTIACAVAVASAASATTAALAQYRTVDSRGQVTYTDKPSLPAEARVGAAAAAGPNGGALPYEVRQAMSRYPVALYAAKSCVPCDRSRQWLKDHGIPFAEFSVDSNEDVAQLKQRFGDNGLPVVTIGSQVIRGFSSAELQSYADAAGYPKQARVMGYVWPEALPLVPPAPPPSPQAPAVAPPAPRAEIPPPAKNGIQF